MPFDLSFIGQKLGPFTHRYGPHELALYALSVGASADDLAYLLEGPAQKLLPSYGVLPTVNPIFETATRIGGDPLKMLHFAQRTERAFKLAPEGEIETTLTVTGIWDMVMGGFAEIAGEGVQDGQVCVRTRWQILFRGQGGFGGPRPPPTLRTRPPEGASPAFEVRLATRPEQALLYRLNGNGDLNPIHARPEVAKAAGFERPILHGLCTYGMLDRIALRELLGDDPERFLSLEARFAKPVYPGDTLLMRGYLLEQPGRAALTVSVLESGAEVIGNALLEFRP